MREKQKYKKYDYFQKTKQNSKYYKGYDDVNIYNGMYMNEDEISIDIQWASNKEKYSTENKNRIII